MLSGEMGHPWEFRPGRCDHNGSVQELAADFSPRIRHAGAIFARRAARLLSRSFSDSDPRSAIRIAPTGDGGSYANKSTIRNARNALRRMLMRRAGSN